MLALQYLLLSAASAAATAAPGGGPLVHTPDGPVRGFSGAGSLAGTDAFRGIPFAAPPVGDLRFAPPAAPLPWSAERDATRFGASCLQMGSPAAGSSRYPPAWNSLNLTDSSEDCLYLNVYVPSGVAGSATAEQEAALAADGPLPVLVYFHAGEFRFGSAHDAENAWPYNFKGKAILVTANVRLGMFGYAALDVLRHRDPSNSTGNYGMQDLRAVLQWVQRSISAFSGDPKKVTIFGESSGGSSVAFHVTSKKSRGLFSRAILESPGLTQSKTWEAQETNTQFVAAVLAAAGGTDCAFPAVNAASGPAFRPLPGITAEAAHSIGRAKTPDEARTQCATNPSCMMVVNKPGTFGFGRESFLIGPSSKAGNLSDLGIYLVNITGKMGPKEGSKYSVDLRLAAPASLEACLVGANAADLVGINMAPPYDDTFRTDASAPTEDGVELARALAALSRDPSAISAGVALMAGANLDEGTEFMEEAPAISCNASAAEFATWSGDMFGAELGPQVASAYPTLEQPVPLCRDRHGSAGPTSVWWQTAMRASGDSAILCPAREMLAARGHPSSAYWYFFTATPIFSVNMGDLQYMGAFHGAEVPFVFGDAFELSSDGERQLSATMGCYWSNFAATGNPNDGDCTKALKLPAWPALGEGGDAIVFSNTSVAARTGLKKTQCDLFAKYPSE